MPPNPNQQQLLQQQQQQRFYKIILFIFIFAFIYIGYNLSFFNSDNNRNKMSKAVAVLKGEKVNGVVKFTQESDSAPVLVEYEIFGLEKGNHGFHVHEFGDTTNGCLSAGAHYNPYKKDHGSPDSENRHVGDLGNIHSEGPEGATKSTKTDKLISLFGQHSIVGRTMIVHADEDDLGLGSFPDSKTTGHAGARVACGVIGLAPL